jgi:hypothetical protein
MIIRINVIFGLCTIWACLVQIFLYLIFEKKKAYALVMSWLLTKHFNNDAYLSIMNAFIER